jgi:uncharacterized protein with gpF-like domain
MTSCVTCTITSVRGPKSKKARRDRRRRLEANRSLRVFELRFKKALKKYQRGTAAICRPLHTHSQVVAVLHDRMEGLRQVIFLWLKRIAHHFGKITIDHIEARLRRKKAIEIKKTFDRFADKVLRYLSDEALDLATTITGDLVEEARDILQTSFEEGMSEKETADLLAEKIEMEDWELERIARTEGHTAANVGSDAAAEATGADLVKEWAATEDSRTRPSHVEADGQRQEMDDPFRVGDAWLDFPGDPDGPAEEVINCRCVVLYHPRVNGEVLD